MAGRWRADGGPTAGRWRIFLNFSEKSRKFKNIMKNMENPAFFFLEFPFFDFPDFFGTVHAQWAEKGHYTEWGGPSLARLVTQNGPKTPRDQMLIDLGLFSLWILVRCAISFLMSRSKNIKTWPSRRRARITYQVISTCIENSQTWQLIRQARTGDLRNKMNQGVTLGEKQGE